MVRRVTYDLSDTHYCMLNGCILCLDMNKVPLPSHQRGSVTIYTVRIFGDGTFVGQGSPICTTSPCLYIYQVSAFAASYTIYVASINGDGAMSPEKSTTINGETTCWEIREPMGSVI